mgnify:CR=1 FL=1
MDAQGALDSLLGWLTTVLVSEAQLLGGIRGDVEFIKDEMESMDRLVAHITEASPALAVTACKACTSSISTTLSHPATIVVVTSWRTSGGSPGWFKLLSCMHQPVAPKSLS